MSAKCHSAIFTATSMQNWKHPQLRCNQTWNRSPQNHERWKLRCRVVSAAVLIFLFCCHPDIQEDNCSGEHIMKKNRLLMMSFEIWNNQSTWRLFVLVPVESLTRKLPTKRVQRAIRERSSTTFNRYSSTRRPSCFQKTKWSMQVFK